MCQLTRRNLLLGASGLLLFAGCAQEEVTQANDYYPVTQDEKDPWILHWGKNSTIQVNTAASGSPSASQLAVFEAGLEQWVATLSQLGITLSYSTTSPDVNVNWLTPSQMASTAGSDSVLGYASTNKNIYMRTDLDNSTIQSTGVHEFGHMLGIWSHSFDRADIMYPYDLGQTELTSRDIATLRDFLYQLTPSYDMHNLSGPSTSGGIVIPEMRTYYTSQGCSIVQYS
jgi:hypothetical protein